MTLRAKRACLDSCNMWAILALLGSLASGSTAYAGTVSATVTDFAGLDSAISSLSGFGTIELGPGTFSITADYTIPDNVSIIIKRGAIFSVDTGRTLTINAELLAGRYQIFSLSGTASVNGTPRSEYIYPEWFHPGGTDWSTAISKALTFANGSIPVSLGHSVYEITQPIQFIPGSILVGAGANTSIIKRASDVNLSMLILTSNSIIRDIGVDGDRFHIPTWTQVSAGVLLHGNSGAEIFGCELRNVIVKNQNGQGIALQHAHDNRFADVTVSGMAQRGINISAFSHHNIVSNLIGISNEKSDIIIGHGSHSNIVSNVISYGTQLNGIWFQQDSHDNTVSNVRIRSPSPTADYGILLWNAYKNHIDNVQITGFPTGILLRSDSMKCSTSVPGLWDDDTRDNVISNVSIDGVGGAKSLGIHLHKYKNPGCPGGVNQDKMVVSNIFSNVTIDNVDKGVLASSDAPFAPPPVPRQDVQDNIFSNFIFHNISTATFDWSGRYAPPVNKTPYP